MSWAKLCGTFAFHRKVLEVGNEGAGAFARMIAFAAEGLTGGKISTAAANSIAPSALLDRLVDVGLLERDAAGFVLHDYGDFNPSGEELEQRRADLRAKRAEAGRRGANARWGHGKDGKPDGNGHGKPDGKNMPTSPSPSPSPSPVPVTRDETTPVGALALTGEPTSRPTTATKARPEIPGHGDVIACHVSEYEALRSEKPIIDGKTLRAAKVLLATLKDAEAACAVIRRAYAESDFVRKHPDLMFIATNVNDWRGASPSVAKTGAKHPLQPVPASGRAWEMGS